mgnify:CR=1 FL=1
MIIKSKQKLEFLSQDFWIQTLKNEVDNVNHNEEQSK